MMGIKFVCMFSIPLVLSIMMVADSGYARTWQVFNETCHNKSDPLISSFYCSSLEKVVDKLQENTSVQIDIEIPQLQLNNTLNFINLTSLMIIGKSETTQITCTRGVAGIVLRDIVDSVSIKNLKLISCGSKVDYKNDTYVSALTIIRCYNVELNEISISNSDGVGLTFLYHKGGSVNVSSTVFKENKFLQEDKNDTVMGGGGVLIKLDQLHGSIEPMSFIFVSCSFENNAANTTHYNSVYTDAMGEQHGGYGQGGGVGVRLKSGVNDILTSFLNCTFKGNQALFGSGLAFTILEEKGKTSANIQLQINSSTFIANGCDKKYPNGFGGGAYLTIHANPDDSLVADTHYSLKGVNFTGNCAMHGGGVYYYSSKQTLLYNTSIPNSISFEECTFESNSAHVGAAIIIAPSIFFTQSTGHSVTPVIQECQFLNNVIQNRDKTYGIGTIYVTASNIRFQEHNIFQNNSGTALHVVNGIVNFSNSNASFINNTGVKGGAIALIGSSTMIVGPHNYTFTDNSALYRGGAIYVFLMDKTDFTTSRRCFIQYQDGTCKNSKTHNAIMIFDNNSISYYGKAGHVIFATTLKPCRDSNDEILTYRFVNILLRINQTAYNNLSANNEILHSQISTNAVRISTSTSDQPEIKLTPGIPYKLSVTAVDEMNSTYNGTVRVAGIENISGTTKLDPKNKYINREMVLSGDPQSEAKILLHSLSSMIYLIRLTVKLAECPPGFQIGNGKCKCNAGKYAGLFKCNGSHSLLLPGYWAGMIKNGTNGTIFATSAFPYYNYNPPQGISGKDSEQVLLELPVRSERLTDVVCGLTRYGTACGNCRSNLTVHFNSPDLLCTQAEPAGCKFGWLFYILSELIPATLLFITITVFGISFTSGAINGFILFSQLVVSLDIDANGIIYSERHKINKGYQVVYGIFNMEFFYLESLSFCIGKNASALDILALKYVTILYTIILIVVVIWTMNKCGGRCFGQYCRITTLKSSAIHGISTFLIICYSQCVKTSLGMIIPLHLHIANDEKNTSLLRVWFNGELVYFSKEHLPYAIPAIVCLLTIGLLPPLLLLSYPLLNKVLATFGLQNQKLVVIISEKIPISSLKPLLDSFQGCFKDNLRFFAGLYFLYRWIILFVYIFIKDLSVYYHTISGSILLVLTLHTLFQPYIKRVHNIIDTLLFVNLLLINFLSSFNYHNTISYSVHLIDIKSSATVQQVLIYLPLVVIVAYISTVCYQNINSCKCKGNSASTWALPEGAKKLRQFVHNITFHDKSLCSSNEDDFIHERIVEEQVEYQQYLS